MKQNMTKHPPRTTLKNIKVSLRKQERLIKKIKNKRQCDKNNYTRNTMENRTYSN